MSDPVDVSALVAGWWRHARVRRETPRLAEHDDGWADVDEFVGRHGAAALPLVVDLVAGATSDEELHLVAAGLLEELVHTHGAELCDELDDLARRDPRFRQAMAGVWLERGSLDAETEARLSRWTSRADGEP